MGFERRSFRTTEHSLGQRNSSSLLPAGTSVTSRPVPISPNPTGRQRVAWRRQRRSSPRKTPLWPFSPIVPHPFPPLDSAQQSWRSVGNCAPLCLPYPRCWRLALSTLLRCERASDCAAKERQFKSGTTTLITVFTPCLSSTLALLSSWRKTATKDGHSLQRSSARWRPARTSYRQKEVTSCGVTEDTSSPVQAWQSSSQQPAASLPVGNLLPQSACLTLHSAAHHPSRVMQCQTSTHLLHHRLHYQHSQHPQVHPHLCIAPAVVDLSFARRDSRTGVVWLFSQYSQCITCMGPTCKQLCSSLLLTEFCFCREQCSLLFSRFMSCDTWPLPLDSSVVRLFPRDFF